MKNEYRPLNREGVARSSRALVGSMVTGWGPFNLVEGIIDHLILQVHHVVQRATEPQRWLWDLGFLVVGGLLLIVIGEFQIKKAMRMERELPRPRINRSAA